jgi:hypothetical protein
MVVAFDLDGTLAEYNGYVPHHVGAPVPVMVDKAKAHIVAGDEIRVLTARMSHGNPDATAALVQAWCQEHLGVSPVVTCVKSSDIGILYDDKARQVIPNTGLVVSDTGGRVTTL